MAENERNELNRREFLRKAAITGAVAWAVPVIQSVAATPAYAQTPAVRTPRGCQHSLGGESGGGCAFTGWSCQFPVSTLRWTACAWRTSAICTSEVSIRSPRGRVGPSAPTRYSPTSSR